MEDLLAVTTLLIAFATPQKRPRRSAGETHPLVSHSLSRLGPFKPRYRTIDRTSCEIVSNVVTVFEFASNARCATIRLENSVEMLTFDCSSAPSSSVPRPPAPATPTVASPEAAVVIKLLPPEAVNPAVFATVATASCPIVEVRPLLNCAVITPAESTTKLWYTPLVNPSWLFAVLLEAAASCEIVGVPLLLFKFQLKLRSLAPSANVGNVMLFTLPVGDTRFPDVSNVSVPVLFEGTPVASPVGSATE